MVVFVTGATGLLGSHLLYFLAVAGHIVLALRREQSCLEDTLDVFRQYPGGDALWQRINWVVGDVLHPETLAGHIRRAGCVYHCAAMVSFNEEDKGYLLKTNLKGTENVAALCLEYKRRLCYVSSIAALGDAEVSGDFIDEDTPVIAGREHSVYSHSKGEAEKIVWKYIGDGLDAVMVCPSVILGAGMWKRSSARLFLLAVKGVPVYTRGVTGYVDVRDVCELMIRLSEDREVKGKRFVLNGGNYSYQELFDTVARVAGKWSPFLYLSPWMSGIIWRLSAFTGKLTGNKPAFTRETARTSHQCSYYSNARILTLYTDFHFYTLQETVEHIYKQFLTFVPHHK